MYFRYLVIIVCLMIPLERTFGQIFEIKTAVNPSNGHTYHLLAESPTGAERFSGVTWSQAEAYAQTEYNSHLVTINDSAENAWITETFTNHTDNGFVDGRQGIFIGYTDRDAEGVWQWVSGETPGFENWIPGEPNGAFPVDGTADFALLLPKDLGSNPSLYGQWFDEHDVECFQTGGGYNPNYALVEIIPEPATLALLVMAGLVLLRRRQ